MLTLRDEQLAAMAAARRRLWADEAAAKLREQYPSRCGKLGPESLNEFCVQRVAVAIRLGLAPHDAVSDYVVRAFEATHGGNVAPALRRQIPVAEGYPSARD